MGLDYSYLLYFKRDQLWDALLGVVGIANPHRPPVRIHFPEHELYIPLETWRWDKKELYHYDPEISFSTVLFFEKDEAILDYLLDRGDEETYRSPLV